MIVRRFGPILTIVLCALGLLLPPSVLGTIAARPSANAPCWPATGVVTAQPGWQACMFAQGGRKYSTPDSLAALNGHVFVAYKNNSKSDGSGTATSSVVEYTSDGTRVRDWQVPGRSDGLRAGPDGRLYVLCDPDATPRLFTITPDETNARVQQIVIPSSLPHGGGIDDIAFIGGQIFVSGSNPIHLVGGVNTAPAIYRLTLAGNTGTLTPFLLGNAQAIAITPDPNNSGNLLSKKVFLNLNDPDSLMIDPQGDLVLTNVATQQVITIHNPTVAPTVTSITAGTVADEVAWEPSGQARMLVADEDTNSVYEIRGQFDGKTMLISASEGQTIGLIGRMDPSGQVIPLIIGSSVRAPSSFLFLTKE
jgi:hypothetical protein